MHDRPLTILFTTLLIFLYPKWLRLYYFRNRFGPSIICFHNLWIALFNLFLVFIWLFVYTWMMFSLFSLDPFDYCSTLLQYFCIYWSIFWWFVSHLNLFLIFFPYSYTPWKACWLVLNHVALFCTYCILCAYFVLTPTMTRLLFHMCSVYIWRYRLSL